jgi:hypothetical protein
MPSNAVKYAVIGTAIAGAAVLLLGMPFLSLGALALVGGAGGLGALMGAGTGKQQAAPVADKPPIEALQQPADQTPGGGAGPTPAEAERARAPPPPAPRRPPEPGLGRSPGR